MSQEQPVGEHKEIPEYVTKKKFATGGVVPGPEAFDLAESGVTTPVILKDVKVDFKNLNSQSIQVVFETTGPVAPSFIAFLQRRVEESAASILQLTLQKLQKKVS